MAVEEKITEEQASEALRALVSGAAETEEEQPAAPAEETTETPAPAETPAAVTEGTPAVPAAAAPEEEDVASLRKRLDEEKALHESRWKAMQDRSAQNERILRERYLRKSTATDKALKILKAARTEQGVPETEVDRAIQEIEGTLNPASTQYTPPPAVAEDQAIILNEFLNEKGMTIADSQEFGNWIKGDGATALSEREQALAGRDLDGFLRIAHLRYSQAKEKPKMRDEAVEAVRSVQRVQKEAARAASASPTAPRKLPAAQPQGVDVTKLTKDDVSTLLRQSVEQNR